MVVNMPIKKCKLDHTTGYKWGDSGKCYPTKKQALKQGRAVSISKAREAGHNIPKKK